MTGLRQIFGITFAYLPNTGKRPAEYPRSRPGTIRGAKPGGCAAEMSPVRNFVSASSLPVGNQRKVMDSGEVAHEVNGILCGSV